MKTYSLQPFVFETVKTDPLGNILERQEKTGEQIILDIEGIPLELVKITGGTFIMGSPDHEKYEDEKPQHPVTVPDFYIAKYPITQEQYEIISKDNPSCFRDKRNPVESVSWYQSNHYCTALSNYLQTAYQQHIVIRLPSEAEWEYACRAGTTTVFNCGDNVNPEIANYDGNYPYQKAKKGIYRGQPTNVGQFPANQWGVYDFHGGVWEYTADDWVDNYDNAPNDGSVVKTDSLDNKLKVIRGGSWFDYAKNCRCAERFCTEADNGGNYHGFRVVAVFS